MTGHSSIVDEAIDGVLKRLAVKRTCEASEAQKHPRARNDYDDETAYESNLYQGYLLHYTLGYTYEPRATRLPVWPWGPGDCVEAD